MAHASSSRPQTTPPTSARVAEIIHEALKSTPINSNKSSSQQFESEQKQRPEYNDRLVEEMAGHFVGPMPVEIFLDAFFPQTAVSEMTSEVEPSLEEVQGCFNGVQAENDENLKYTPLMEALQPYAQDMTFRDTHAHPDVDRDRLAPDISLYDVNDSPETDKSPTDFSKMSTFIEVKKSERMDPFEDSKDIAELERKSSKRAAANRGQIGSYSAAISGTQFRVHVFSVSICGDYARLIRWDRSAAIVTKKFNYIKRPELLVRFFWRYSRVDRKHQGHDTTVSAASEEEEKLMDEAGCKDRIKDANPAHREFRKMMVPDRDDAEKEQPFLISYPPCFKSRSPFGRATRAMLAFDLIAKKLVFLKDYWRADVEGMEKEGDIYKILAEKKVKHIAPFGMGNDLKGHETVAQDWGSLPGKWRAFSNKKRLIRMCHYRMTLNVVGRTLTDFRSSKQYIGAIADAMEAHDGAYFDAKILHRDISVGNILLTDEQQGMLIDWDLCLNLNLERDGPRRPDRTGTWQFMSAKLLQNTESPQGLEDDRESAFYVLLWVALAYSLHCSIDGTNISTLTILKAFDYVVQDRVGNRTGGDGKMSFFMRYEGQGTDYLQFVGRPVMDNLVEELVTTFKARYDGAPNAVQVARLEKKKAAIQAKITAHKEHPLDDEVRYMQELQELLNEHDESPAFIHKQLHDRLHEKGWLVNTIRSYLDQGDWPEDESTPQIIIKSGPKPLATESTVTSLKRKVPENPEEQEQGEAKRRTPSRSSSKLRSPPILRSSSKLASSPKVDPSPSISESQWSELGSSSQSRSSSQSYSPSQSRSS